eukprot:scaffold2214_cov49-Phaeocystis_antarctica.AAC.2
MYSSRSSAFRSLLLASRSQIAWATSTSKGSGSAPFSLTIFLWANMVCERSDTTAVSKAINGGLSVHANTEGPYAGELKGHDGPANWSQERSLREPYEVQSLALSADGQVCPLAPLCAIRLAMLTHMAS